MTQREPVGGTNRYRQAAFLSGAAHIRQLPPDQGREVAFAGRSNVGKSSAINTITGRRGLARASKTPGRTRQINFFRLDETRHLVDLPGYGYAKVPEAMRRAWGTMMEGYLRQRQALQGAVLLMDARRPLTPQDRQLVDWCRATGLAFCVVLTKCDKLSRNLARDARRETLQRLMESVDVASRGNRAPAREGDGGGTGDEEVILFSALRGEGIEDVRQCLDRWLAWESCPEPRVCPT
uniref:Probable GTP-binding protein EngB n=1 Tax=Candidatus Kentrum sp. DK TaxID=2126562 RepID=A0A450RUV0_9GAMM|nr:MAG: cell division checkpoint GTPase YihA [Candidatus Kentron sp. DK]